MAVPKASTPNDSIATSRKTAFIVAPPCCRDPAYSRPAVMAADYGHLISDVAIQNPANTAKRGQRRRKQSIFPRGDRWILRGACHQARVRATRWLANDGETY